MGRAPFSTVEVLVVASRSLPWRLLVASLVGVAACGRSTRSEPELPGSDASDGGAAETGGRGGAAGPGGVAGTTGGDAGEPSGSGGARSSGGTSGGEMPGSGGASGNGGTSGRGGTNGGASPTGGASGSGAAGGSGGANVEYGACLVDTQAVPRLTVFRADRALGSCSVVVLEANGGEGSCTLLASGGWCLYQARRGNDVDACLRRALPTGAVSATAASGTFSVSAGSVDLDVSLVFTDSSDSVAFDVSACRTDCAATDCRR